MILMLGSLIAYSGIVTKSKAMSSKLINLEDYNKIAQLESPADFASFLKSQPGYAPLFANIDERSLHRGQIEHILMNSLYLDYIKLYRFADGKQRGALKFIFFRHEVTILKTCMQLAFSHINSIDLTAFTTFFSQHSQLNVNELVVSTTMEEFIAKLKDTEYYSLFVHIQNNNPSIYDYESQLDIYYFKRVWEMKDTVLKGAERKAIKHTIGCQIDLLNIMWIYRSKKFYDIDLSKIYATVIPVHYKLKNEQLTKLVEAATINDFMAILSTTYYGRNMKEPTEGSIENAYRVTMNKIYKQNEKLHPASIAPIYSFFHLKEQEIDRLTTALECIRYSLEPKEVLNYVLQ